MREREFAARIAKDRKKDTERVLVLGLLAFMKWDRVHSEMESTHTRILDQQEYFRIMERISEQDYKDAREAAQAMLRENASKHNHRGYWGTVWQGVVSSWAYALSLLFVAWAIKSFSPSDIVQLINAFVRN